MQRLSINEISQQLDQIAQSLKEGSKDYMSYPEAVFVANTFYRNFGRNINQIILSSLKKASDASNDRQVSKVEIRNIINNAQEEYLVQENNNSQIVQPNVIRTETREQARTQIYDATPIIQKVDISSTAIYQNNNSNNVYNGARRSNTFRSNVTSGQTINNLSYESRNITNSSNGVKIIRTSGTSRNNASNNYSYSQSAYQNGLQTSNSEFTIVQESRIQRAQMPTNLLDAKPSITTNTTTLTKEYQILDNVPKQGISTNFNSQVVGQNGWNINNSEYSSELSGFTIKYGDYSTKQNPYISNSSDSKVVYNGGVDVRRA